MWISLSLWNYKKGWGRQKWVDFSFYRWRRGGELKQVDFPKEVKFQVRVWRRRFQPLACTVPEVYGLHLWQEYGCIDCSVRLLQNWHELRGGSTARTARIPRCTDLYGAFNSAQIPRWKDSVRLGKFGTIFEVIYCCIKFCTAAFNFGTCPEICTACQLYGRGLIWHGNRGKVLLGFKGQLCL